jgi:hypothetical protein
MSNAEVSEPSMTRDHSRMKRLVICVVRVVF